MSSLGLTDFSSTATASPGWNNTREIKLCDLCGRNFLRHKPVLGIANTECPDCQKALAARAQAHEADLERYQKEEARIEAQRKERAGLAKSAYNRMYRQQHHAHLIAQNREYYLRTKATRNRFKELPA